MRRSNSFLFKTLKQFHFTLSTATNPLTTLNKVIACLGCWRVLLLCFIYSNFTDVLWKVYVKCWICYAISLCSDDKNGFKKKSDAHRNYLFSFCYLLCYVLCLPYSVIIPVLHHGLIWLLAFLRNRFWWKDNSSSLSIEQKWKSIQLCIHNNLTLCIVQLCVWSSSWKHVIW